MSEKTIHILGEDVKIKFCMAVICMYERATGTAFDIENIQDNYACLTLYAAAISAMNPNTQITFDRLLTEADCNEIAELRQAVIDSINEFYHINQAVMPEEPQPSFEESHGEMTEANPKN